MMFNHSLLEQAENLLQAAREAGVMIATAESCTGGLVSGLLTEIAGSSDVVDRGFVTYSYAAKTDLLGVDPALLEAHGAVSEPVARAMADGALSRSAANIAVAITGVAGPGASEDKPAGLVHFALAVQGRKTRCSVHRFEGKDRSAVRLASVATALDLLAEGIDLFAEIA